MQFRPTKLALLTLTAILALSPAHATAQTQVESNLPGAGFDQPDSTAPTIQVYSRETIVDVLVTDDKGHPVHGLSRSDFTIEEDNHPQPIRSFSEYSKDAPAPPPRTLPPNTFTNARALPASGPVQIFFFDFPPTSPDAAIPQASIYERAKHYIADYLRTMPAGTEVAVFSFLQDKGLRLLQGFTTDGKAAASAVDNLDVEFIRNPPKYDPLAALNQIAAYVAGIHGRKNLIWITPAPPMINRDGGYSWAVGGSPPDMTYVHRLMDLYDIFTREQIAIYPLDPRGVHGLGWAGLKAEEIAEGTGGATSNSNDYKGTIAKIVDDTSHFYTLSYIPPRPNDDGHYHAIKIAVDRPGLHLVYRGGYNDEHPAPPDSVLKVHMNQDSMGLGALPATQLVFDLQVTPARTPTRTPAKASRRALPVPGKTRVSYDLIFKLSQTQITFATTPDGMRTATLEFDLAAYDANGKAVGVRSQTLKLPLTLEEYQDFIRTPFQFYLSIDLPPGQTTLRAGVFDAVSNKAGTLEIPLTVPGK
jgi:VWFA-related protein